jgi:energy-coupling factor transporter transmembrane protein EcfT
MVDPPVPTIVGSIGNGTLALTFALAIIASTTLGFMFARVHDGHRQRSIALLTTAVFVSAALNLGFTLVIQVVMTAVFIAGLIVGGRVFSLNHSDATERHSIV